MDEKGVDEVLLNDTNYKLFSIMYNHDKKAVEVEMDFNEVDFEFIPEKNMVRMKFNESDYEPDDLKVKLLSYANLWINKTLKISKLRKDFLKSNFGASYMDKLHSGPLKKDKDFTTYGCIIVYDDSISIGTNSDESYTLIKKKLDADLHEEIISMNANEKKLLESVKWKDLLRDFQKKVYIKVNDDNIELVGDVSEVRTLKTKVQNFFKMESQFSKKIELGRGQYMLFKKHIKELGLTIEPKFDQNYTIELNGSKDEVEKNEKLFKEKFLDKIVCHSFEIDEKGLKAESFDKGSGNQALDTLKAICSDFNCYIDVTDKNKPGTNNMQEILKRLKISDQGEDLTNPNNNDDTPSSSPSSPRTSAFQPDIQVVKESLTECKDCDVLVNIICGKNSKDLSTGGIISKEFNRICGKELQADLDHQGYPEKFGVDLTVTKAYGSITHVKWIYHVFVGRYHNDKSHKLMKVTILNCLKETEKHNCASIAFPTIGCGKLGYDPKEVCKSFVEAAHDFKKPIKIKICAFDDNSVGVFDNGLKYKPYQSQSNATNKNSNAVNRNTQVSKILKQIDNLEEKLVTFTIYTLNKDDIETIEEDIKRKIKDLCSSTTISHSAFTNIDELSHECRLKLLKLISSVSFHLDGTKIIITGIEKDIRRVGDEVKKILDEEEKLLNDLEYVKKHRGLRAYYSRCCKKEFLDFPSYWKLKNDGQNRSGKHEYILSDKDIYYKEISEIVMNTWDSSKAGGIGKDAIGLTHSNIEIKKITRYENPNLYGEYLLEKKKIMYRVVHGHYTINDLQLHKPKTFDHDKRLNKQLVEELNEFYLFHGTKRENIDIVFNSGIDSRFCGDKVLFGQGSYFAESSTKADQYTDVKEARKPNGTIMTMFLSRVLLGKAYVCTQPRKFNKPPCVGPNCQKFDKCPDHNFYDSVIGTHKDGGVQLLFKEYVVYDKNLCYPEFLIEYIRK